MLWDSLRTEMTERALSPGDVLIAAHTPSHTLYVVDAGELAIAADDGTEIGRCGPGSVVGEIAFLDRGLATVTVRARGETHVRAFERDAFDRLAREQPRVAADVLRALCATLSARIRKASDQLEALSPHPPSPHPPRDAHHRSLFDVLRSLFTAVAP